MSFDYKDVLTLKQFNKLIDKSGAYLFYNDSGCNYCFKILQEASKLLHFEKAKLTLISISHFNTDYLHDNVSKLPYVARYGVEALEYQKNKIETVEDIRTAFITESNNAN